MANELFDRVDHRLGKIWRAEHLGFVNGLIKAKRWDVFTYPDLDGTVTFMVPGGGRWTINALTIDKMTDEEIVQWVEAERAASLIAGE